MFDQRPLLPKALERFGRFLLTEALDSDELGPSFRALDPVREETFVIRFFWASPREWSSPLYAKIRREFAMVMRWNSPYHQKICEMDETGKIPYLLLEPNTNVTLGHVLTWSGTMRPDRAAAMIREIFKGLSLAWSEGLCHFDLSPDAILMTKTGHARILGFGTTARRLAMMRPEQSFQAINPQRVAYAAPELIRGLDTDFRADIYSMGALLYHALTGVPPYQGQTPMDIVFRQATGDPTPPNDIVGSLPAECSQGVQLLMARDVNLRPSSPQLVDELLLHIEKHAISAKHTPFPQDAPHDLPPVPASASASDSTTAKLRESPSQTPSAISALGNWLRSTRAGSSS